MCIGGRVDVFEDLFDSEVLMELLADRTTGKNIIWATDDYANMGDGFKFCDTIEIPSITGENGLVIRPRTEKDKEAQRLRSKVKAEVFTPAWVCNMQNNMVDDTWFGTHADRFNKAKGTTWESTYPRRDPADPRGRIRFPRSLGKTWQDYVLANCLEVSCGEAPYLTSRYDAVNGRYIRPKNRIGLLDRKLRVIYENVSSETEWLEWAEKALMSTYGFEWQGDNILLARENLLLSIVETYTAYYSAQVPKEWLVRYASVISWNVWQMDGIKFVIPNSCHPQETVDLLGNVTQSDCPGCKDDDPKHHNGIYPMIMDWQEGRPVRFIDIQKGG